MEVGRSMTVGLGLFFRIHTVGHSPWKYDFYRLIISRNTSSPLFSYPTNVRYLIISSLHSFAIKNTAKEKPNIYILVFISDPSCGVDSSKWSYWVEGHDYI